MNARARKRGMNCIFNLATISIIASLVSSCARSHNLSAQQPSPPKVVASHSVICDLVKTIAQDTVDLTCLLNNNQDPHTYSPNPSDRKALTAAQLILYGGYQLEPQLIELIEATKSATSQSKIPLFEQVVTEPIMTEHDHEDHEDHEDHDQSELNADPHVWHNVEHVLAMVKQLQSLFIELNPDQREFYLANSATLSQKLSQLDAWIEEMIETIPPGQRVLITAHDSLNYYSSAYHLEDYQTLQGISSDSSPTAAQVRDLATKIRQANVPTIFAESTKSDRVIKNVARAAKVELSPIKLYVDGLGEAETYTEMMSHNTCGIVDGLGGKCQTFSQAN